MLNIKKVILSFTADSFSVLHPIKLLQITLQILYHFLKLRKSTSHIMTNHKLQLFLLNDRHIPYKLKHFTIDKFYFSYVHKHRRIHFPSAEGTIPTVVRIVRRQILS